MMKLINIILFVVLLFNVSKGQQLTVTNTNDSGPGSLRQAIINANSNSNTYSITFSIPVSNNQSLGIHIYSPLPNYTSNAELSFVNYYATTIPPYIFYQNNIIIYGYGISSPGMVFQGSSFRPIIPTGTFVGFGSSHIYVTNTSDNGTGSLRDAIYHANICATNLDSILFNISGIAPQKIIPVTQFTPINSPVFIDGSTQPNNGYTGSSPKVELDGTLSNGFGFVLNNSSEIYGLYIHRFNYGIKLTGNGYTVGANGKGNVVSGCASNAIVLGNAASEGYNASTGASNVVIQYNLIGTDPTGTVAEPNTGSVSSDIGGALNLGGNNIKILNNLISGNTSAIDNYGMSISANAEGKTVNNIEIKGNKIGTDINGQYAIPNNSIITFSNVVSNLTIGGPLLTDRNIISGNNINTYGCPICLGNTQNYDIENNFIGTDITGTLPVPNSNFFIVTGKQSAFPAIPYGTIKNNLIAYNNTDNHNIAIGSNTIITKNSFYNNTESISVNPSLAAPVITHRSSDSIVGTAMANIKIELYEDNGFNKYAQGKDFVGKVLSDANGNWKYIGSIANPCQVTGIAIDTVNNNSSSFSSANTYSIGPDITACANTDTVTLDAGAGFSTYLWSTGDTTRKIKVTQTAYYSVVLFNGCMYRDTVRVNFLPTPKVFLGNDTTLCSGKSLTLNAGNPGATYEWNNSTSSTNQQYTTFSSGLISVVVTIGSCVQKDTIKVTVIPSINLNLGSDKIICQGSPVMFVLNATNMGATYLWSDNKTTPTDTITALGTYWVNVSNSCFSKSDTIIISSASIIVNLGNDTTLCNGQSLTLDAKNLGATYKWDNNISSTKETLTVNTSGIYFVDVTKGGCTVRDSINVSVKAIPIVNLGADTLICNGSTITLDAKNTGCNYLWSTGSTTETINVSNSGVYSVEVFNQGACNRKDSITITFVSCDLIYGNVFEDLNQNCIQNSGERNNNGEWVEMLNTETNTSYYATTDLSGNYSASLPYGNYIVSLVQKNFHQVICPVLNKYAITLNGIIANSSSNFAVKTPVVNDFSIGLNNIASLRVGSEVIYYVTVNNLGNDDSTGQFKFVKDPFMSYGTQTIASQIIGDTLIYKFPPIGPGLSKSFAIYIDIPLDLDLRGNILCANGYVFPSKQDMNLLNNNTQSCSIVNYSYDPNYKTVSPAGTTSNGFISISDSILMYTINFQNTGTDTAHVVVITDSLSSLLNIGSLDVIGASHPQNLILSGQGLATFTFNNIMLPDSSTNEKESHGFVQFTVRLKQGIPINSVIKNYASIYFDLNPPIVTKETITTLSTLISQTVNFPPIPNVSFDHLPIKLNASASSGLGINTIISGPVTLNGDSLVLNGSGDVRVRVYQQGNAVYNAAQFIDRTFKTYPAPVCSISNPSNSSICANSPINFNVTLTTGVPPFNYKLSNGIDTFSFNNQPSLSNVTVTPTSSGMFKVLNVVDSTQSSPQGPFGSEQVTVYQLPSVSISAPSKSVISVGEAIDFTLTLLTGNSPFSFTLSNGTDSLSLIGATSPVTITVKPTVSGVFKVLNLTDNNSCSNIKEYGNQAVTITAVTGIVSSINQETNIEIYPNPSQGNFEVRIPSSNINTAKNITISIYNSAGILVDSKKATSQNLFNTQLGAGTYFVFTTISNKIFTQKLVIE